MSPKLPRCTAAEIRRAIERAGFKLVRQSGSHQIFRDDAGTRVTLPAHPGRILHPKIVKRILEDTQLTEDDL
jgi:predicted RNA binding protein YcfA (HicA-like mRNA interferase family)